MEEDDKPDTAPSGRIGNLGNYLPGAEAPGYSNFALSGRSSGSFQNGRENKSAASEVDSTMDTKITPSSGNVFRDLGFDEDEAEHLRIRSTLMIAVRKLIEDRSLTQGEAAKLFRVTQPRISNLVRGRIDLFSIDTLVDMLARAGIHIDAVFSTARQGAA
jgi:predicted XRE-type DNA-binding protein